MGKLTDACKCLVDGKFNHQVANINSIPLSETHIREAGFRWRGICTVCKVSIVAKDKSEYKR